MKQAGTSLKWKLSYKGEVVLEEKLTSERKEACIEAKLSEVYKWTAETRIYMTLRWKCDTGSDGSMWLP